MERKGNVYDLDTESVALGKIKIDMDALPENEKSGTAKKLLGSSVLFCYVGTLAEALHTRGAEYETISGNASVFSGNDENGRYLVQKIEVEIEVKIAPEFNDVFSHVQAIMKKGCHISASIAPAIPIVCNIKRVAA